MGKTTVGRRDQIHPTQTVPENSYANIKGTLEISRNHRLEGNFHRIGTIQGVLNMNGGMGLALHHSSRFGNFPLAQPDGKRPMYSFTVLPASMHFDPQVKRSKAWNPK